MVTNMSPIGNQKTIKRERVSPSFTNEQLIILDSLVGEMGKDKTEVLKNIFIAWLSEKNITPAIVKKKMGLP